MRIGLVIEHFDPRRGGAEQWTYQHAACLLARGHEVHVVTQSIGGPATRLAVVPHCLGRIRSMIARAEAAEHTLRHLGLDIIHDIGMGWYNDILQSPDGSRIAQWEQMLRLLPPSLRPWKRALIGLLPRYREFRRLMARQFGDPRRIVLAVSGMCAHDYAHYHHVPHQQIRTVYHGADHERFSPAACRPHRAVIRHRLDIHDDETVFLFVGHDYRRKGLVPAIRALERLAAEGHRVRLLVVGGKRHNRLPHMSDRIRRMITMTGPIDDPVPYYAAADALVLPTFYDPFGLVVLEAAGCCLPVVTTQMAGASELLTDGVDGYVVTDPADDWRLAECMRTLLDPAVRHRMGAAARELATRHSLDRSTEEILALYHEIAGQRRCAA